MNIQSTPLAPGAPCPTCFTPVVRRANSTVWCCTCRKFFPLKQNKPIDEAALIERTQKAAKDGAWAERAILTKPKLITPVKG